LGAISENGKEEGKGEEEGRSGSKKSGGEKIF
jgi:hypothetical protein